MTATGPGSIFGELDGITSNAQGIQDVSDSQAGVVNHLGSTFEALAPNFQGQAGTAMQAVGQRLHAHGATITTSFANHAHMMQNNAALLSARDEEHQHILNQVANLA